VYVLCTKWCGRKENDFTGRTKQKATPAGSLLMVLEMIEIMKYSLDFIYLIIVLIG